MRGDAPSASCQAPSLAAKAARYGLPALRFGASPLTTRRRTDCRWGSPGARPHAAANGAASAQTRQARVTGQGGGVPGAWPQRRRKVRGGGGGGRRRGRGRGGGGGGRRPGVGGVDAAPEPPWMGSRRPGRGPPAPPPPRSPPANRKRSASIRVEKRHKRGRQLTRPLHRRHVPATGEHDGAGIAQTRGEGAGGTGVDHPIAIAPEQKRRRLDV